MSAFLLVILAGCDHAPVPVDSGEADTDTDTDADTDADTDTDTHDSGTDPCASAAPPGVQIVTPAEGDSVAVGDAIQLTALTTGGLGTLTLTWTIDGVPLDGSTWTPAADGTFHVDVTATDECNVTSAPDENVVTAYTPIPEGVTPFGADAGIPATTWYGLSVGPDGRVWGAGLAGLVSLDPATGEIHTYKAADGLLTDTPHAVLAHSDGTLWVGHVYDATRQGEHVQPNPDGTLTMLEPIDYTESSEITSVFRLREQPYGVGIGDVWMGTNEGLCIWDSDLGVFSEHAHPTHPHGYSYGVAFTPDADVWNGDQYQLSRWDYSDDGDLSPSADLAETVPTWPVEISYPISITDLDADGATLWVSSSLYGVARVDVSDTLGASTVELFAGEWPSNASAIRADGAGNVWIGGPDGLWRWDGTALHAVTGDWLPSGGVQQITVDRTTSPPTVWIATPSAWVRIVGTP